MGKENMEVKVRLEEAIQKQSSIRLKMEAKIQEKEFKIILMKNQIKSLVP
jgi:hypothetical protein